MNGNTELLNFIYQNSQMGITTIEQLLDIAKDAGFLKQLHAQLQEYTEINRTVREHLHQNNLTEKDISAFDKFSAYLMINMKTLTDKSASHIAEMMIIGSNMGIIDAIKHLRQYSNAEPDILRLMEKLLTLEENNVRALKAFL